MAVKKRIAQNISIEGMEEIIRKFKNLATVFDEADMATELVKAATVIRNDARSRAPVKTGNLRRGIVAKRYQNQIKKAPGAFVAIDYRIAPHAHLVEFGHGGPHPAGAHPFFRLAIDANRDAVRRMIEQGAIDVVEKAAKR